MKKFAHSVIAAAAATVLISPTARAYEIWIDLNTYAKSAQGGGDAAAGAVAKTNAFAGADGVWLITANSGGDRNTGSGGVWSGIDSTGATGFSLTDWRTMIANIAGPNARLATEDNPPPPSLREDQSYRDANSIIGTSGATGFSLVNAMKYNETGIDPAGGTVLSNSQIAGYATKFVDSSNNSLLSGLTRSYVDGGANGNWKTETDRALVNANIKAMTMETTDLDGQNVQNFLKAVRTRNKTAYLLIGTYNTARNVPGIYYLKQQAPAEMASGQVRFVLNNNYNRSDSTNGYSFYGSGDTVEGTQDTLTALRNAVPIQTFAWQSGGGNWSTRANWTSGPTAQALTATGAINNSPSQAYDAANFTSGTLSGDITATVDIPTARSLAVYFGGAANYTINGTQALTLGSYGTHYSDGRVPFAAGLVPTAVAGDANSYKANVVPIQIKGTGTNTLAAPVVLDASNAVGLVIDQQNTGGVFTLSGKLTTAGLPIMVQGAGTTVLSGQISGGTAITKTGTGTLNVGGGFANTGATATVQRGTLQLSSTSANAALDSITDIAAGATVSNIGTSTGLLSTTALTPTLTINGGGTVNVNGRAFGVTAVAGTSGTITNNNPTAATFTTGLNNVSGSFDGTLKDGAGKLAFAKTGAGTQTLSGASTYSGSTTLAGGTLTLTGGDNRLPTGTSLTWTGSGARLNLGGTSQTLADVNADGVTGVATGGTLTLAAAALDGTNATFDFSGLTGFKATQAGGTFAVNGNNLVAKLGSGTAITAGEFDVGTGDFGGSTNTATTLTLGGSSAINADVIRIGNYHASATVNTVAGANSTVGIRGAAGGTSRSDVTVGFNAAGAQSQSGTLDFRDATLDARVGAMTVARYSVGAGGSATATGTFSMDAGLLDAQSITLAASHSDSNAAGATVATFNHEGGVVRTDTLTLGTIGAVTAAQTTTAQTATYNLGTTATAATLSARSIAAGTLTKISGNTTASRTLNFVNGTIGTYNDGAGTTADLNIAGSGSGANGRIVIALASTGTHTFDAAAGRTIYVQSNTVLTGAGGTLTKTGPGALRLLGAETYTGPTQLSQGSLTINGSLAGNVNAAIGTTLAGIGTIAGTLRSDGSISPGDNSAGRLAMTSLAIGDASSLLFDFGTAKDLIDAGSLALGRDVALHLANTTGLTAGTYALIHFDSVSYDELLSSWTVEGLPSRFTATFQTSKDLASGAGTLQLAVSPVPEPTLMCVLSLLAAGLIHRPLTHRGR